jgi:hypothetical protein
MIVSIIYAAISDLLRLKEIKHIEGIVIGISMLLAGTFNFFVSKNYYINSNGDREYYEEEGTFMFIKVTLWTRIFFVIGVINILGAIADIYKL